MAQLLIPPVPLGEEFDSTAVGQWLELVRRYINTPIVFQSNINPTVSDVSSGSWLVWKNTSLGETRIWTNDGGVLRSVLLT